MKGFSVLVERAFYAGSGTAAEQVDGMESVTFQVPGSCGAWPIINSPIAEVRETANAFGKISDMRFKSVRLGMYLWIG